MHQRNTWTGWLIYVYYIESCLSHWMCMWNYMLRYFNGIKTIIRFNKIEFHIELMKYRMVQFIIIVLVCCPLLLILNFFFEWALSTKPSKNNNQQRVKTKKKQNTNGSPIKWYKEIWLKKVICDIGISKKITRSALTECTRTHTHAQWIERNVIDFNLNISWYFFNGIVAHWSPSHYLMVSWKKNTLNKCIYF